jgi:hypothetical protein
VPPTVAHTDLIATARREIRALPNPGIRPDAWRSITALLAAIAGYLPDPFPSQRVLAKKLGKHHQAIHRTLDRARALGLVTTTPRTLEKSYRDGQTYTLLCLSEGLKAAVSRQQIQATLVDRRTSSSSKKMNEPTSSGGGSSLPAAPVDQKDNVVPFNRNTDDDWSSPAIGEDPKGSFPATRVSVDPAVYLARRFDVRWAEVKRTTPALRVIRASSRGMAIGYLRKVMLPEVTPEHIEAYFDAFIAAVVAGDVIVKESQFAFERFTGWWGREDVEDPAAHAQARATAQWAIEQVRRQRGEIG